MFVLQVRDYDRIKKDHGRIFKTLSVKMREDEKNLKYYVMTVQ